MESLVEIVSKFSEIESILNVEITHPEDSFYRVIHRKVKWILTLYHLDRYLTVENIPSFQSDTFVVDLERIEMSNLRDIVFKVGEDGIILVNNRSHLILYRNGALEFIPRPYTLGIPFTRIEYKVVFAENKEIKGLERRRMEK